VEFGFSRICQRPGSCLWYGMPRPAPRRLPALSYVGTCRYSVRFCTAARARLFASEEAVGLVLSQFLRAARETGMELLAYCFMPDHVHLLVEGTGDSSDGRRFISLAKQYSGFYFARRFGRRLWQPYGYERVLRNDEATLVVARYILENPIRAGLVEVAEDYPYLGSTKCTVAELLAAV
jgi:putative transposase